MRIFIDANVLISVLNKEYPIFSYSSRELSFAGNSKFTSHTTATCLAIAFYFSSKKSGEKVAKRKIKILSNHFTFLAIDTYCISAALNNPKVIDLEDGMQYYAAVNNNCSVIVTENTEDYYFSEIPVVSCAGFLKEYSKY